MDLFPAKAYGKAWAARQPDRWAGAFGQPRYCRSSVGLALGGLVLTAAAGLCLAMPSRADAPQRIARDDASRESDRLIETLSARLLIAHSATAVLEAWCAERGLAADPRLIAVRVPGPEKPLKPDQRARLAVPADEPIRYRRVRLTCGGHVLSEADNWYVPGRLTPEMNAALETSLTPFGRVVHPLNPVRRNLAMAIFWKPGQARLPGPDDRLFSVEAVLSTNGVPFCEVAETYTGAVLARGAATVP